MEALKTPLPPYKHWHLRINPEELGASWAHLLRLCPRLCQLPLQLQLLRRLLARDAFQLGLRGMGGDGGDLCEKMTLSSFSFGGGVRLRRGRGSPEERGQPQAQAG